MLPLGASAGARFDFLLVVADQSCPPGSAINLADSVEDGRTGGVYNVYDQEGKIIQWIGTKILSKENIENGNDPETFALISQMISQAIT